ncbi:MAG: hypothetical protein RLZZ416_230 [Candidatus Parcubacteria bacterium]|jgi:putative hemolysin
MRTISIGVILFAAIAVAAAYWYQGQIVTSDSESAGRMGIANPAAVHCTDIGGDVEIAKIGNGSQIGYCHLTDGRVCEEWALFRDGACVSPTGN